MESDSEFEGSSANQADELSEILSENGSEAKPAANWRDSPPPVESFSDAEGANENGDWTYSIIGEEVDHNGDVLFEVRWDDWSRPDGTKTTWIGTKTTWMNPSEINSKNWKTAQKKRRNEAARNSLAIDVISSLDIHNSNTYLRSQAFEEKLARFEKEAQQSNLQRERHSSTSTTSRRSRTRQPTETSMASSSSLPSSGSQLSRQTSASTGRSSNPIISSKGKGKRKATPYSPELDPFVPRLVPTPSGKKVRRVICSESPEDLPRIKSPSPEVPIQWNNVNRRNELSDAWTKLAEEEGAKPIFFVNQIDGEPIPELDPSFCYLESKYKFSVSVEEIPAEDFLVTCSCKPFCSNASECACQEPSDLVVDGVKTFAYTSSGLFKFNVDKGMEVIECNKFCVCSLQCINRVSQRPRDVPVEIFKTSYCGWGVRPVVNVKRGKVLGIYTGLVLQREVANSLSAGLSEYVFDLDGDENEYIPCDHPFYSVDSRIHGNWTRFINHSCSPNLQIYLVVNDVPPNAGLPYIAFVAIEDIRAHTEFTFDYRPKMSDVPSPKGKIKAEGMGSELYNEERPCYCGSENCRGFI